MTHMRLSLKEIQSNCGNIGSFVLGVKSFHGNSYDGHTLNQTIAELERTTGQEAGDIFVDLTDRGNNYSKKSKVYTPYTKKQITPEKAYAET